MQTKNELTSPMRPETMFLDNCDQTIEHSRSQQDELFIGEFSRRCPVLFEKPIWCEFLLIQAEESVEEAIFRLVDKYQVCTFIQDIRLRIFDWDGHTSSLRPENTAVASCDGVLSQLKYLTSDPSVKWCADNLVIRVKHHASLPLSTAKQTCTNS